MTISLPESLFPRDESDEVALEVALSGVHFTLTHANTEIYTYRRNPEVNHIYHTYREEDTDKQLAVFGVMDLIETLRELNFGERVQSRPTNWDEKAYLTYEQQKLDKELEGL